MLTRTGIPLGIFDEATWEKQIISFTPGDNLVVCTDGITEAQNPEGDFFGQGRLFEAVQNGSGGVAKKMLGDVMTSVERFTHLAHQYDDIAVVVVQREAA